MGELKSCPFCGSEASDAGHQQWSYPVQNTTWDDGAPIDESFSVNCLRCGISTLGSWGVGHRTKELAIAKWNARALTPAQQAAEEMAKALEALQEAGANVQDVFDSDSHNHTAGCGCYWCAYRIADDDADAALAAWNALAKAGKP